MRTRDPFDIAKSIAGKTDPLVTRYNHASVVLDRKNRVIATGTNHFAGNVIDTEEGPINKTVHSEADAIRKTNIRRLSGATIINYCRTNAHTLVSKPCPTCWAILKKLGFRKVFYSLEGGLNNPVVWMEEAF